MAAACPLGGTSSRWRPAYLCSAKPPLKTFSRVENSAPHLGLSYRRAFGDPFNGGLPMRSWSRIQLNGKYNFVGRKHFAFSASPAIGLGAFVGNGGFSIKFRFEATALHSALKG